MRRCRTVNETRPLQHCASVREGTLGFMPLSPLNRIRMDRQIAKRDTRQHRIALPQGVSGQLRLKHLICLSNLTRISIPVRYVRPVLQRARVLAARRVLDLIDDPRFSPGGARRRGRWSASCRSAITGPLSRLQLADMDRSSGSNSYPAGCFFCTGDNAKNILHVGLD